MVGAPGTTSTSTGAARALAAAASAEWQQQGNTATATATAKAAPVGRGWRVLFFGSDEISLATLDLLLRHHRSPPAAAAGADGAVALEAPPPPPPRLLPVGVEALEVVTGVDKVTSGRSVPVKQFALRTGLPLHQPPRLKEWAVPRTKDGHAFDIGVVVSFGHFIPPSVLDALPWGAINMHPSLLPRHRGAAPIYHTLLQDDSVTGVTVLEIHRQRFDAGRIFSQTTLPVDPVITYEPLARQLATVGAQKVLETLASYEASLAHSFPQDDHLATRAPKIDGLMAQVHWERHQPRHVHNLWRALGHSLGVHTYFRSSRLKLVGVVPPYSVRSSRREPCPAWPIPQSPTSAAVSPGAAAAAAPGQVEYDARRKLLWIKCAAPLGVPAPEGAAGNEDGEAAESRRREEEGWVAVREVQIEGRRVMGAAAFKNGFLAPSHTSRLPPVSFTTDPRN